MEEVRRFGPGLILLDIMLPELYGVAVLKRLREAGSRVPVNMLTDRDTTLDKVHSSDRGNPLEPEVLEHMYYAPGVGPIGSVKVVSGPERADLVEIQTE